MNEANAVHSKWIIALNEPVSSEDETNEMHDKCVIYLICLLLPFPHVMFV